MKLLRYGAPGQERPGMIDGQGRLRDLSAHVSDIDGAALQPAELARLARVDANALPLVDGSPRIEARRAGERSHWRQMNPQTAVTVATR